MTDPNPTAPWSLTPKWHRKTNPRPTPPPPPRITSDHIWVWYKHSIITRMLHALSLFPAAACFILPERCFNPLSGNIASAPWRSLLKSQLLLCQMLCTVLDVYCTRTRFHPSITRNTWFSSNVSECQQRWMRDEANFIKQANNSKDTFKIKVVKQKIVVNSEATDA